MCRVMLVTEEGGPREHRVHSGIMSGPTLVKGVFEES